MANKKFSEFVLKTSTSDVSHIVGYNGAENVQITPANFVTTGGTGVFLPLAGGTMVGNTTHNDNVKSIYGTSPGNDLQIYHDGSNSFIKDAGTGDLIIDTNTFRLRSANGGETMIRAFQDSAVILSFNNVDKLATTSTGISVTGDGAFTGDVSVAGSGAKIISASSSDDNASLFLSAAGSGKDTHIVYGNNRDLLFETSSSTTPTSTGTPVLTLGTNSNATFAGNVSILQPASSTIPTLSIKSGVSGAGVIQISGNNNTLGSDSFDFIQNGAGAFINNRHNSPLAFSTNNLERMRLDASGNLGIGVTPSVRLDVIGGTLNGTVAIFSNQNGRGLKLGTENTINNDDGVVYDAQTSTGKHLFKVAGSEKMRLDDLGNLGLGAADANAYGKFLVSGTGNLINGNATSGAATFQLYENGAGRFGIVTLDGTPGAKFTLAGVEKMRLDASGNLGVGASNPTSRLHLKDTSNDVQMRLDSTSGGTQSGTITYSQVGQNSLVIATEFPSTSDTNLIQFKPGGTLAMTIRGGNNSTGNAGNVGIGTSTPQRKLTIYESSGNAVLQLANNTSGVGASDGFLVFTDGTNVGLENKENGYLSFATDNSEKMRLTSDGDLLIGVTSIADATSRAYGNAFSGSGAVGNWTSWGNGSHSHAIFRNGTNIVGTITTNTTTTTYNTSSDYRLKEDLQDFEGLDLVSKIPVYDYKWKADDSRSYGVMAHELEEVLPQAVSGEKDAEKMQSVDYSKIVPLLVKSIQELSAKLEALECQCEKK